MGCRSDYLEATGLEKGLREAAHLAIYLDERLNMPTPAAIREQDTYYSKDAGQVQYLCNRLRTMTKPEMEMVVYDAHSVKSRQLATWWEAHQAADAARIEKERAAERQAALLESARAKLSPEEFEAVRRS